MSALICPEQGKLKFASPQEAERRRKVLKKRHNDDRRVYRCHHCKLWHLGHGDATARPPKRR